MRNITLSIIISILSVLCFSCTSENPQQVENYDKLKKQNIKLKKYVRLLRDSVAILKFTAPDRLIEINELVSTNQLDSAKIQIDQLKQVFPNSKEAKDTDKLVLLISRREQQIRNEAEKERLKKEAEVKRLAAIALKASTKKSTSSSSNISSSSRSYSSTCGARTKKGGSCKRKVSGGGYCYQHR